MIGEIKAVQVGPVEKAVGARRGLSAQWVLLGALFVAYLLLGAYISLVKGYLPGDALARLDTADLVFHGHQVKLATIGFVWPPIPTLLIVPFTLFQPLVDSWLALVVVSALSISIACLIVGRIALACGITGGWRWLIVLLFATNPLIVEFAANGLSEGVLIALALGAFYWMIRFWEDGNSGYLVVAATLFGLLPMVRYELAALTGAALVLVVAQTVADGHTARRRSQSRLQARIIAYASMAGYPTLLWIVASWQIMGSPIYFLVNDRSALSVSQIDLGNTTASLASAFQLAAFLWTSVFPAAVVACIVGVVVGIWKRSPFLVALALLPFILPVVQAVLLSRNETVPLVRYYVLAVPLAFVVYMAALRPIIRARPGNVSAGRNRELPGDRRTKAWTRILLATMAATMLLSSVSTAVLLASGQYQDFEHETWLSLTSSEKPADQRIPETIAVGRAVRAIVPGGSTVLLDEYQYGYALELGAGDPGMFVNHTDPQFDDALKQPWAFVDYLLVPNPEGRGALYAVNRYQPDLYSHGASWAELVDGLPPSEVGWRLYKVLR